MRSRCFWLLFLLIMSVPTLVSAKKTYTIEATSQNESGDWRPVESLQQSRHGVAFDIQFLDPAARREVIEAALGRDVDLLPGRIDDRRPGFLVFVLKVENGSEADVNFNPTQTRLATEKGDMEFALDYTAFYELARRMEGQAPTFDEVGSIAFDRTILIRPGGSVRKLLAFEAPREDRWRTLEVRLHGVTVGTAEVDVVFPFRKFFETQ